MVEKIAIPTPCMCTQYQKSFKRNIAGNISNHVYIKIFLFQRVKVIKMNANKEAPPLNHLGNKTTHAGCLKNIKYARYHPLITW